MLLDLGRRWFAPVWRHLGRAFGTDLLAVQPTPAEKGRLEAAGIVEESFQKYAVWRRSTLWIVAGPALLSAVLATIGVLQKETVQLSLLGEVLTVFSTLILYVLPISAVVAALNWSRFKRSHRWLFYGWTLAFLPPFLLALFPVGWWFEPSDSPEERLQQKLLWDVLDAINGLYFYCTLMPAVLSLLPGMIRACLRIKTLLPASIVSGWFLVAGAPFFLLLWLVALILLNHLAGNPLLLLGILIWIGAPMLYVQRSDLFVRPITAVECREIIRLQKHVALLAFVAMLLLLAFVLTKTLFGYHLVGLDPQTSLFWLWQNEAEGPQDLLPLLQRAHSLFWLGQIDVYQLVTEYLTRSVFVTVVFADLLLRMNLSVWQNEKRFQGTEAAAAYDAKMSMMQSLFVRKHPADGGVSS